MQEWNQQCVGTSEIARRTGKSIESIQKYCDGDPMVLCQTGKKGSKRKRPSMLDCYKDIILEILNNEELIV